MQQSEPLDEKQDANLENEPQIELKTKKSRSDNRILKIAAMDNGTLFEAFKFLNYMQLAKGSLVSKRFWDVIRTNRHSLPLLYVAWISMRCNTDVSPYMLTDGPDYIKMFDKRLSAEEYNKWVIHKQYPRQIPFEGQAAGSSWPSTQHNRKVYHLAAYADYNAEGSSKFPGSEPYNIIPDNGMTVLSAHVELDCDSWPLFQHIVRLITDPSVYIRTLQLTTQNEFYNLLAEEISSKRDHLQCLILTLNLDGDSENFVKWITDHVLCSVIQIYNRAKISDTDDDLPDELLVDFFLTGSRCTSEIIIKYFAYISVITEFVQKFMDLKKCDEYQVVESIRCNIMHEFASNLKRKYAKFIVKEDEDYDTFEFINSDIGKKLKITHNFFDITRLQIYDDYHSLYLK